MGGQAPPDAATRAKSGRPAGGRRSRGCPDAGHAGRRPVRVLCPPCGRPSNRSRGRPVSTRPVSTRPVPSRCPDGRTSGVRGSAAALSAPWDGSVRPAVPLDAMGSTCRRGPRAAWSPAPHTGLKGRDGAALAVGGSHEGRRQTGPPHRTRTGCGAASPPADKGAGPAPGCRSVGWGARERAGAHQSPRRCVLGRLPAWCPTMGLDREVVTTLRGRWAGDGPVSSVPESPSGSVGSSLRPQRGRGT
jgi:hypothetical protein